MNFFVKDNAKMDYRIGEIQNNEVYSGHQFDANTMNLRKLDSLLGDALNKIEVTEAWVNGAKETSRSDLSIADVAGQDSASMAEQLAEKTGEGTCEVDDKGKVYMKNGELLPNNTYEINGVKYETDENGRIISWDGEPEYAPDNERDLMAQTEAGGNDRKEGDDGGHLVARILGGSSGLENIVPMRDTVNRGDYKRSENEIVEAKRQGKDVQDGGRIIYEDDSSRPTKIERNYSIDGEKRTLVVDNVEGSKDLLDSIKNDISEDDMNSLQKEVSEMEADGCEVTVTSIYKKYDTEGNLESVTIGIRNETDDEKSYRTIKV